MDVMPGGRRRKEQGGGKEGKWMTWRVWEMSRAVRSSTLCKWPPKPTHKFLGWVCKVRQIWIEWRGTSDSIAFWAASGTGASESRRTADRQTQSKPACRPRPGSLFESPQAVPCCQHQTAMNHTGAFKLGCDGKADQTGNLCPKRR